MASVETFKKGKEKAKETASARSLIKTELAKRGCFAVNSGAEK